MRCLITEKDETDSDSSALSIWNSDVQNPCILETVENINGIETKCTSDTLSTLYSLDSVSQSYKRKILECEKEDFENKFCKIQRKRQMLRATAKANLVIDDDEDDDDFDEEEIYERMEWFDNESNAMTLHLWKDKNVDFSIQSINTCAPIMYISKFNWREERHHLLRISMAKIRGVDDPETYLRRSVLINNTVKRLQKDVAVNYRSQHFLASSLVHENINYHPESNNCDLENSTNGIVLCKPNYYAENTFQYSKHVSNNDCINSYIDPDAQTANPYNLHLSVIAPFSPDKPADFFQNEVLQNSVFSKSLQNDQSICNPSFSSRALKQVNSFHTYSSQPCGLQYRNALHEETNCDYPESSSSSLLDSVVYHSLIASLET